MGNPQPVLRVGPLRPSGKPRFFGKGHLGLAAQGEDGSPIDLLGWGWAGSGQGAGGFVRGPRMPGDKKVYAAARPASGGCPSLGALQRIECAGRPCAA